MQFYFCLFKISKAIIHCLIHIKMPQGKTNIFFLEKYKFSYKCYLLTVEAIRFSIKLQCKTMTTMYNMKTSSYQLDGLQGYHLFATFYYIIFLWIHTCSKISIFYLLLKIWTPVYIVNRILNSKKGEKFNYI